MLFHQKDCVDIQKILIESEGLICKGAEDGEFPSASVATAETGTHHTDLQRILRQPAGDVRVRPNALGHAGRTKGTKEVGPELPTFSQVRIESREELAQNVCYVDVV